MTRKEQRLEPNTVESWRKITRRWGFAERMFVIQFAGQPVGERAENIRKAVQIAASSRDRQSLKITQVLTRIQNLHDDALQMAIASFGGESAIQPVEMESGKLVAPFIHAVPKYSEDDLDRNVVILDSIVHFNGINGAASVRRSQKGDVQFQIGLSPTTRAEAGTIWRTVGTVFMGDQRGNIHFGTEANLSRGLDAVFAASREDLKPMSAYAIQRNHFMSLPLDYNAIKDGLFVQLSVRPIPSSPN